MPTVATILSRGAQFKMGCRATDPISSLQKQPAPLVSFRKYAEMVIVPARLCARDANCSTWYDGDEYQKFVDHCQYTVEKMENGARLKDKKYSSVGLEHFTHVGAWKRKLRRNKSISAVIQEQQAQIEDGKTPDYDSIAELYQASSSDSLMVATTAGLRTEREVKEYLDETMDDDTRSYCSMCCSSLHSTNKNFRSPSCSSLSPSSMKRKERLKRRGAKKCVKTT